jgi:hypothetical protein
VSCQISIATLVPTSKTLQTRTCPTRERCTCVSLCRRRDPVCDPARLQGQQDLGLGCFRGFLALHGERAAATTLLLSTANRLAHAGEQAAVAIVHSYRARLAARWEEREALKEAADAMQVAALATDELGFSRKRSAGNKRRKHCCTVRCRRQRHRPVR